MAFAAPLPMLFAGYHKVALGNKHSGILESGSTASCTDNGTPATCLQSMMLSVLTSVPPPSLAEISDNVATANMLC